jgi:hypothetical protein
MEVLPKASDLPDTQLQLIAFGMGGIFLTFWLLSRIFSAHITKLMDTSAAESEKDRQLHREVTHGLVDGLNGVSKSVDSLGHEVRGTHRKIDKLAVAITGKFIDDDSHPIPT